MRNTNLDGRFLWKVMSRLRRERKHLTRHGWSSATKENRETLSGMAALDVQGWHKKTCEEKQEAISNVDSTSRHIVSSALCGGCVFVFAVASHS